MQRHVKRPEESDGGRERQSGGGGDFKRDVNKTKRGGRRMERQQDKHRIRAWMEG